MTKALYFRRGLFGGTQCLCDSPLAGVLLLFWFAGPVAAIAGEPVQLKVLSYNIHHGEGVDRKLDLERIARVILSVEPDLVVLQEVDKKVKRSQAVDQPTELARLTKMNVVFGANIELQGGHYGNAALSRFPIVKHENHLLPRVDDSEQRGVLVVDIAIPQLSQSLRLLATHLDYRCDAQERLASAQMINALATKHAPQPTLLAGDLNDTPESKTLTAFKSQWTITNEKPIPTVPVITPKKQIDFILYRPAIRWNVLSVEVLDEQVASDHLPILAVIEVTP